jgi:HEAT repeat protein
MPPGDQQTLEPAPAQDQAGNPETTPGPMTAGLIGRLFVVPAVIVCVLLAVAAVVVLFGTSAIDKPRSIAQLLSTLEGNAGDRTLGQMLLPGDREYWQAAQQLSSRLEQKEKYLRPEEAEPTARRLIAILDRLGPGRSAQEPGARQQYFLLTALAHLETASAVPPVLEFFEAPYPAARIAGLRALAQMRRVPEARQAVDNVLPLLEDGHPEVEIVACAALAALGEQGDPRAIRALEWKIGSDREVRWNAALALARLGSASGKLVLMNMLDRAYWEGIQLDYQDGNRRVQRQYTDLEVSNYLSAALEAAGHLDDDDLADLIRGLCQDESHVVREAARAACRQMRTGGLSAVFGGMSRGDRAMEYYADGVRRPVAPVDSPRDPERQSLTAWYS